MINPTLPAKHIISDSLCVYIEGRTEAVAKLCGFVPCVAKTFFVSLLLFLTIVVFVHFVLTVASYSVAFSTSSGSINVLFFLFGIPPVRRKMPSSYFGTIPL